MLSRTFKSIGKIQQRSLVQSSNRSFFFGSKTEEGPSLNDPPKRVVVTGAAGNIAYSALFRIASGEFLGKNQRIILHLLDLPFAEKAL